jgi:hypothetical protein
MLCKGARLLVRYGERTTAFEITEFHPPTTIGWVEEGARSGAKTFFHLGFAGATTSFRVKHVTPLSLGKWLQSKLSDRRDTHRVLNMTLQNIRKLTTA